MNRKRLISFLAALMLGMGVGGPAAAMTTETLAQDILAPVQVVSAPAVTTAASTTSVLADPIIDESIEGLGHLFVEVDQDNMSVTVGVGVEPLGVDERVTFPPADGGDGEPTDEQTDADADADAADAAAAEDQAGAQDKASMDDAKASAAAAPAGRGAAFSDTDATDATDASGSVDAGAGVVGSFRAPTPPTVGQDTATGSPSIPDPADNIWLQVMASLMLAGTATAWSFAKRLGLL
ncbi:MAG: hypothetical protein ACI867_000518 [Glaciecola sp.]